MSQQTKHHNKSRLFHLLISGENLPASTLAKRIDISERSVYRLIAEMKADGIDIHPDSVRGGYVIRYAAAEISAGYISQIAATALAVASQLAASQVVPFGHGLGNASQRIAELMFRQMRIDVATLLKPIGFSPSPSRETSESYLELLARAVVDGSTVEMVYYTAWRDDTSTRKLDPYYVTTRGPDWYVVGFCHKRQQIGVFAVSRIKSMKVLQEKFTIQPDFDAERFFENALGAYHSENVADVAIDFRANDARWVTEREWHPSQHAESLPNGDLRIKLRVGLNIELRRWILSWGAAARVVSPPALAQEVAAELRRAAQAYD